MALPTLTVEVGFDANPGDPTSGITWTDITEYVWSLNVRRGRQHELDRTEAGTLTLVLNNNDRRFDPTYSASPYAGKLLPMRPIRVSGTYNATTDRLLLGYVESWQQQFGLGAIPQVEVHAVDGFKVLSMYGLRGSTFAEELSHTRIANVLSAVGWSTANATLSTGHSLISAADFTSQDQNALEHLQAVAQAESGRLYCRGDGAIRFDDRHAPYNSTAVQFTVTEGYVQGVELEYSDANIYNEVDTQNSTGTLHTTADTATSQVQFLKRTLTRTGLPLADNNEPEDLGSFLLTNYKDPAVRVTAVEFNLLGKNASVIVPQALGRELGERVTVDFEPRTASAEPITQESFIEGVEHDLQRGGHWRTRWRLSAIGISYTLGSPWILGTNELGAGNSVLRY